MKAGYLRKKLEEEGLDKLPSVSFPGLYPILYTTTGGKHLCADCATRLIDQVDNSCIYLEGTPIECDECGKLIESAYGDPIKIEDMKESV